MRKKVYIRTFGCQMNMHDSEKMAGILLREDYALTETLSDADLIIFNTCSIRQKAEQKFRSELGKANLLKRKRDSLRIAVAGCIAQQRGGEIFKKNPYVDYIFGPQNISKLDEIIKRDETVVSTEENPDIENEDFPVRRDNRIKAWVSIMYGCDNFCAYCIVPYTRGRERSRPSDDICREVSELGRNGYKEATLLGQNVNSYRSDVDFAGLLKKVDSLDGIERIRFVTSHPRDLSGELIESIERLSKVCEHIHLPIQSGSDRILKLMNRGYTFKEYMKKAEKLREMIPGISITTDIIAGFPSETEEDHKSTVNALKSIEFDGIFAFKYSPRPGTKAAEMDGNLEETVKSMRLYEILELQDEITLKKNRALEGAIQEVLIEGISKSDIKKITGRTRTNKIVNFKGNGESEAVLAKVKIIKAMRHSLEGELIAISY